MMEVTRGLHINSQDTGLAQRARPAWRRQRIQIGSKYSNIYCLVNKSPVGRFYLCFFSVELSCWYPIFMEIMIYMELLVGVPSLQHYYCKVA